MQPVPPGKKVFNPNYVALSWSRQLIMPAICQRGCHWQLHGVPQLMIFFIQFCNVTASIAVTVIWQQISLMLINNGWSIFFFGILRHHIFFHLLDHSSTTAKNGHHGFQDNVVLALLTTSLIVTGSRDSRQCPMSSTVSLTWRDRRLVPAEICLKRNSWTSPRSVLRNDSTRKGMINDWRYQIPEQELQPERRRVRRPHRGSVLGRQGYIN